jgi:hypothetical protein
LGSWWRPLFLLLRLGRHNLDLFRCKPGHNQRSHGSWPSCTWHKWHLQICWFAPSSACHLAWVEEGWSPWAPWLALVHLVDWTEAPTGMACLQELDEAAWSDHRTMNSLGVIGLAMGDFREN